MNRLFSLFIFSLLIHTISAQEEYNSADYINYQKASAVFDLLHNTNYNQIDSLDYNLSGLYHYMGHFPSPRQRHAYNVSEKIQWTPNNASLISTLISGNDTLIRKEIITDNTISILDYGEKKLQLKTNEDEVYLPFYSPAFVYNDILKHKKTIRYIGFDESINSEIIIYNSGFDEQVTVYINKDKRRIESAQILKYENIEGDYYLQFFYKDYIQADRTELPSRVIIKEWNEVKFELACDYKHISNKSVADGHTFAMESIAENIYKIAYQTGTHYSYIIDSGEYLSIIEAPIGDLYMQDLSKFVSQNFPDKPIKYCFLTHHHPDHAGGFRFFYNNGATIVSTELSSVYQKQLLTKKHSLGSKTISSTNGAFDIIRKDETKAYNNGNVKMEALEFSNNGHTTEFLLYYFPKSNILIVGDLYYVRDADIKPSERADKLLKFIEKNKMKVKSLYTTWMPSSARIATINDIKISSELLNQAKKDR